MLSPFTDAVTCLLLIHAHEAGVTFEEADEADYAEATASFGGLMACLNQDEQNLLIALSAQLASSDGLDVRDEGSGGTSKGN